MKRQVCAICQSRLNHIYILNYMPKKLSCIDNPIYDTASLSFAQCDICNTIQLDELIPLNILYSESHNYTSVGKIWENYFKMFCNIIEPIISNKNVLEIGCPSGKIALQMNNYNQWFIVEPNKNVNVNFNDNIIFIQNFFDEHFKIDKIVDVIIHSHLFEHIYEPIVFLKKCFEILSENGEMVFGVPNMEHMAETGICPFLGVFFEHTIFLNKDNITYLLNRHGFEIIKIIDYEKHSTLYHCRKIKTFIKVHDVTTINDCVIMSSESTVEESVNNSIDYQFKLKNYYEIYNNTLNEYKLFVNICNDIIINTNTQVYLFGASYNSQFLSCLGLNINKITGILDNCKEKQGKYLYGYNLKIFDPTILINNNCIVILKNGYYASEIKKQIMYINKNTRIIS